MNHGRRGVALVEAVILLSALLIVLFGARLVTRRYQAEIAALSRARTCAAEYAFGGCRVVRAGCTAALVSASGGAPATSAISEGSSAAEGALRSLSAIPVLGGAVSSLLGQQARSIAEARYDDRRAPLRGVVLLPCNEVPRTDDIARQVFGAVTKSFF